MLKIVAVIVGMSEDNATNEFRKAYNPKDPASVIGFLESRESELTNRLNQTQAELRAAMDGLRDARAESEDLRAYIERMNAG